MIENNKSKQKGPNPDRLNIDQKNDDWTKSVKKALKKKRPKDGWPKPEKPAKKND